MTCLRLLTWLACGAACALGTAAMAQVLSDVTVAAEANRDPAEKSYRKMVRGMDFFERHRDLAPGAELRFRLLPRRADTDLAGIELFVLGNTVETAVPIAPDRSFALVRNAKALAEDAVVVPNRRAMTMTWRVEIRSPGVPDGMRRLGDLRLECEVGLEAGLVSNVRSILDEISNAITRPGFCKRNPARYFFFAERPIFGVTLSHGARRDTLPVGELYAGYIDVTDWQDELAFCDCEVLLDRTYFLPLGDPSWPDDTLVSFDFMEGPR